MGFSWLALVEIRVAYFISLLLMVSRLRYQISNINPLNLVLMASRGLLPLHGYAFGSQIIKIMNYHLGLVGILHY